MARFSKAELATYYDAVVPDLLPAAGQPLKLLFVGINPGLWTAAVQTHFARPGNRFYPALLRAGIIDRAVDPSDGMTDADRDYFRARGLGITNVVRRATARADELTRDELREGGLRLVRTVEQWQPTVVAILGVTAYRAAFQVPKAATGRQEERLAGSELWVLPNPSGLNAHDTVDTLATAYAEAAKAAGIV